jgi:hypothetical protein
MSGLPEEGVVKELGSGRALGGIPHQHLVQEPVHTRGNLEGKIVEDYVRLYKINFLFLILEHQLTIISFKSCFYFLVITQSIRHLINCVGLETN